MSGDAPVLPPGLSEAEFARAVEAFVAATGRMKVGDPADPATEVGPLVTFSHRQRVADYVAAGVAEGAELVCGGIAPSEPALAAPMEIVFVFASSIVATGTSARTTAR